MLTDSDFIFVELTDEMRENAKKTSEDYAYKLSKSIRFGRGTYAGCLGEEMIQKVFPFLVRMNTYDYDFAYGDLTFDVKTKERTVPPDPRYDCSVNLMNGKQKVDHYIFTQVLDTYRYGWILGSMKSSKFFKESSFHACGSVDPSNGFKFHCDTYNIPINQLRKMTAPE